MDTNLELLVALQEIDSEIGEIENLLETLPREIEQHYKTCKEAKEEEENHRKKVEEAGKLRLQKEGEVELKKEAMAKAKNKLHEIKTNQEYKAALAETENVTKAISRLEDEQLELMEEVDASKDKEKGIKEKVREEESKFAKIKAENDARIEEVKEEKKKYEVQRNEIASKINPQYAAHYNKIFNAREGLAVAELTNGFCSACHQSVMPQVALEIRTGVKIHTCQHCMRFLYTVKEEKKVTSE